MSKSATSMTSVFDYQGHEIRLEVSMFSGRESLYLDNQLAEQKRSLTTVRSTFKLLLDGKKAEVRLRPQGVLGALTGAYHVELFVEGQLVDSDKFDYTGFFSKGNKRQNPGFKMFIACTAAGFLAGMLIAILF